MGCIMGTKRNITQENIDFGLTTNAEENLLILNGNLVTLHYFNLEIFKLS